VIRPATLAAAIARLLGRTPWVLAARRRALQRRLRDVMQAGASYPAPAPPVVRSAPDAPRRPERAYPGRTAVRVPWGSFGHGGEWHPNPSLSMPPEEQRQENVRNGYPPAKRPWPFVTERD